nr:uncharacterized protein LOC106026037 [Cavia porcellus]
MVPRDPRPPPSRGPLRTARPSAPALGHLAEILGSVAAARSQGRRAPRVHGPLSATQRHRLPSPPSAARPRPPADPERRRAERCASPAGARAPTPARPAAQPAARSQPGRGQLGAANQRRAGHHRADLSAPPRPRPAASRRSGPRGSP